MRIVLFILLIVFTKKVNAQHKIDIPEFKNINSNDKYPLNTVLSSYTNQFDIVISLQEFSAWGPDYHIKILAHHQSGWYKVEINKDERDFDLNTVCYSTAKINDTIGQTVWETLLQNHLFEMKDSREIGISCITIDTIQYKKGKIRTDSVIHDSGSDMPEYEFEILTKNNYKKLYFYSPGDLAYVCPEQERKWILNSISIFEKYLGR